MSLPATVDEEDPITIKPDTGDSHVIDDAQYSHQRRLRAIHNAHDRVIEVRNAVEDRLITGAINEYHARRYYRGAVESFIMEVLPVLRSDDISLRKDYKEGVDLGQITIEPPSELVAFARQNIQRMPPGASVPTPKSNHIQGVESILTLPSPITHQFSVTTKHSQDGIQSVTRTVREEISRDVLDTAVQFTMEALEDAQMGLNIGEGRPHNTAGTGDGKWPWETDTVLPHEIHDALENGDITRDELEALMEDDAE